MKKLQCCLVTLLVLLLLAGCAKSESSEPGMTVDEIVSAIMESQSGLPALSQISPEDEAFASYLSDFYLIDAKKVDEGVICYADGVEASEIAVLVLADEKDSETVENALKEYMLLICQDVSAAQKAFSGCFSEGKETELQTDSDVTEESYDADAVLQAWRTGDETSLSEMNRDILHAAKNVIDQEITDDMSDYEKELAIHDWITHWSSFDYSVFGRSSEKGFKAGSDTPYGVLIDRVGMCHGYSSTFQLLMDMLDIECMTVFGTPDSSGVQHSWNMVRLDGEWYCVDAAWDDPIGGSPGHTYFNVTSETLRKGSIHRWDDTSVPEATGTDYAYGNH